MHLISLLGENHRPMPKLRNFTDEELRLHLNKIAIDPMSRSIMGSVIPRPGTPSKATLEECVVYLLANSDGIIDGNVSHELPEKDRAWYVRQVIAMFPPAEATLMLFQETRKMASGCTLATKVQRLIIRLLERLRRTNESSCQELAERLLNNLRPKEYPQFAEQLRTIVLQVTEDQEQRHLFGS